jgi:hypothetical protein
MFRLKQNLARMSLFYHVIMDISDVCVGGGVGFESLISLYIHWNQNNAI